MDSTTVLLRARSALEATARRTAETLRSLPDLGGWIPGSEWTVREAAIHLVNHAGLHAEIAEGVASPIESVDREALAAENASRIADIPESDPEKVAALLTEAVGGLLEATAQRSGDQTVRFHAGLSLHLAELVCISLGEQLLHGYDIATAAGIPWPIDPAHADLAVCGYASCCARTVDPARAGRLTASCRVGLRNGSSFSVRFDDGNCRLEPSAPEPTDCTISADPVAFLLMWSHRMSQWQAMALGLYSSETMDSIFASGLREIFVYP